MAVILPRAQCDNGPHFGHHRACRSLTPHGTRPSASSADHKVRIMFFQVLVFPDLLFPEIRPFWKKKTLQWRHNERDGVSNHQPHDCLLNRLFGRGSKLTSKLRVTGLCVGNSGEFHKYDHFEKHYNDVIMSAMASRIPASWVFTQSFVQA